jgi:hypothetical protein
MALADAAQPAETFSPPRMDALAEKLAAQPDMTGIWVFIQPEDACRGPLFDPPNSICPPRLEGESAFGPLPGTRLTSVPYNLEYWSKYDRNIADAHEGKGRDTFAACIPYGVPRAVGESPVPFEIIQAPEVMVWYNPYGRTTRKIFIDGSSHPENFEPSYSGHSVAFWAGNTLVVHTVKMINAYFDETAAPHSDELEMVERLRLLDTDLLENEVTLTDPKAFTRPWIVRRYYRRIAPSALPPSLAAPTKPQSAKEPGKVQHAYINLNDRPCRPDVRINDEGFQEQMLPQELELQEASIPRPEGTILP